jgi:hypothetical protein
VRIDEGDRSIFGPRPEEERDLELPVR